MSLHPQRKQAVAGASLPLAARPTPSRSQDSVHDDRAVCLVRLRVLLRVLLVLALAAASLAAAGEEFDWTDPQVEPREIESGGPGKDGIPAILRPRFDSAADTPLRPRDLVVGISRAGDHRAYPLRILNWHEVVNDVVGGSPVVVTWCPLTGSAIVFDRRVAGRTLSFGVSGRLYQSNVLLYDHQTQRLWSQLGQQSVTGRPPRERLEAVAAEVVSWEDWRRRHPQSTALSFRTGHRRDYSRNPYSGYESSDELMFAVRPLDDRLPLKAKVLGVEIDGRWRAYPLERLPDGELEDQIAGVPLTVVHDAASGAVSARRGPSREVLPAVAVYWFAWAAFHPTTTIWAP